MPEGHSWWRPDFAPRLAYENTGRNWYGNYPNWHRYNGRAFVLNYYYKGFYSVSVDTLDIIRNMPDPYAAMSHYEFFAELYALYYDIDDPKKNAIPQDIADWFENNIGRS